MITSHQTENYELTQHKNTNILTRLSNKAFCYLSDDDANMLMELSDNNADFNMVANSYSFLDPANEKHIY